LVGSAGSISKAVKMGVLPKGCLTAPLGKLEKEEERLATHGTTWTMDTPLVRGIRSYVNPIKILTDHQENFKDGAGMQSAQKKFPIIFRIVFDLLSAPPSNAPEERKFSTAKAISVSDACPSTHSLFEQQTIITVAERLGAMKNMEGRVMQMASAHGHFFEDLIAVGGDEVDEGQE
jgi:hypothetical protein